MTSLNERIFAGRGNRTGELTNTRLDALPTALTGPATCLKDNRECQIAAQFPMHFDVFAL